MLQSQHCGKSLLTSPIVSQRETSFNACEMGNGHNFVNSNSDIDNHAAPTTHSGSHTNSKSSVVESSHGGESQKGGHQNESLTQMSPKFRRRKSSTQSSPISSTRNIALCSSQSESQTDVSNVSAKDCSNSPLPESDNLNGLDSNTSKSVTFSLEEIQSRATQLQHKQNETQTSDSFNLTRRNSILTLPNNKGHQSSVSAELVITEAEMRNLKELVLLHLDLSQRQQAIIFEKDKIITELRKESTMLRTRLERMDRRLSVAKTATPKQKSSSSTPKSATSAAAAQSTPPSTSQATSPEADGPSSSTHSQAKSLKRPKIKTVPFRLDNWKPKAEKKSQLLNKKSKVIKTLKRASKVEKRDGLYRVEREYYTQQVHEFEELLEETIPNSNDTQNIEVPNFRIRSIANHYHLEGTEDLEDQTFYKRHQRHENDEKKRKRWDLQRQREQQAVEKLKQGQSAAAQKAASTSREKHVENIFPLAEQVKKVEICDALPVNVFGHALPSQSAMEFSLPWYSFPSQHRATVRKSRKRAKR